MQKKSSFCEAAARIPFIIRPPHWMEHSPGRVCNSLVELSDILPTLCSYSAAFVPDDVTGISLKPLIDEKCMSVRNSLHGHINNTHMYHDGRFKYIYHVDDGNEFVFDVSADRNDMNPIKGEKVREMRQKLIKHLEEEGHEHFENGELVNLSIEKPPLNMVRARDGAAMNPLASMNDICRNIQHIH